MKTVCPGCERPYAAEDIVTQAGLELRYGIGLSFNGQELFISKAQQAIMRALMQRRFVAHETLQSISARPGDHAGDSVKVQIHKLRGHLKLLGAPFQIVNSPGMGYSLVRFIAS